MGTSRSECHSRVSKRKGDVRSVPCGRATAGRLLGPRGEEKITRQGRPSGAPLSWRPAATGTAVTGTQRATHTRQLSGRQRAGEGHLSWVYNSVFATAGGQARGCRGSAGSFPLRMNFSGGRQLRRLQFCFVLKRNCATSRRRFLFPVFLQSWSQAFNLTQDRFSP